MEEDERACSWRAGRSLAHPDSGSSRPAELCRDHLRINITLMSRTIPGIFKNRDALQDAGSEREVNHTEIHVSLGRPAFDQVGQADHLRCHGLGTLYEPMPGTSQSHVLYITCLLLIRQVLDHSSISRYRVPLSPPY